MTDMFMGLLGIAVLCFVMKMADYIHERRSWRHKTNKFVEKYL